MILDRKQQLQFCKVCEHKSFNSKLGMICGLTGDRADFEEDCESFKGNRNDIIHIDAEVVIEKGPSVIEFWFVKLGVKIKKYPLSISLLLLTILFYLIVAISSKNLWYIPVEDLLNWGANNRMMVLSGEYWRFLVSIFLHGGIFILFVNVFALFTITIFLEPFLGKLKMFIVFIMSGLLGNVIGFSLFEELIAFGSSGAIFGLYGVLFILIMRKSIKTVVPPLLIISMLLLVSQSVLMTTQDGVDYVFQLCGFIFGIFMGLSIYPEVSSEQVKYKSGDAFVFTIAGMVVLIVGIMYLFISHIGNYERLMLEFGKVEQDALEVMRIREHASKEELIEKIMEVGIPKWEECREIINEAEKTPNLPDEILDRISVLNQYCDYRINAYKLMARGIKRKSSRYNYKIDQYNLAVEKMMMKLQGFDIPEEEYSVKPLKFKSVKKKPAKPIRRSEGPPLFVIDGVPMPNTSELPERDIVSLKLLPAEQAVPLFGSLAKNGALLVSTKKGTQ